LGYGLDDRGSRFRFLAGAGNFLFTISSRTVLAPTQPPIQGVPGALYLVVKLTTDLHLVPRSNNEWRYTYTPQYALMAWYSAKAQGKQSNRSA